MNSKTTQKTLSYMGKTDEKHFILTEWFNGMKDKIDTILEIEDKTAEQEFVITYKEKNDVQD